MRFQTSNEVRESFLAYFERHGHERVGSSGLIPANDPTLLFANAGMNQFKDTFLGREKRNYLRACTSQKCVRAGGKHNDLDNVGYTARHHTFFEMLGNFSFGDYFKDKAIELAWAFLTEELGIPRDRLYVTVFLDDDEAAAIWRDQVGVPAERIFRFGEQDNFWSMGDTGPCGPCSEIFYDFGPEADGPDDPYEGIESGSDRYMEIWNLVFMQYDRQPDGALNPLPKPSVDTGMGLERVCAVVQGVRSNYETDLFTDLIGPISEALQVKELTDPSIQAGLRVIADHLRAMSFLIADGVVPSNEGRGYVLRRIMRRAMRFGKQLGQTEPFLSQLTQSVIDKMGDAYPQLRQEAPQIKLLVEVEEKQFDSTLSRGMPVLEKYLRQLQADGIREVPGQIVFFLYGTHGFPADLMADIARDWNMELDLQGFRELLEVDARSSSEDADFAAQEVAEAWKQAASRGATVHRCYENEPVNTVAELMLVDGSPVEQLSAGQEAEILLRETPFYAESGGQIGDRGSIAGCGGVFEVAHTTKVLDRLVIHHGVMTRGDLKSGDTVEARVDQVNRRAIMKNHTATHLLHQALRDELGHHVRQAGSLVDADKTRFDFSHFAPLTAQQIARIELAVNHQIMANAALDVSVMPIDEARASGAMALFGEKYDDQVRVVSIGDYSRELCGGTHVAGTGEIGVFKIVSERGLASGVRRLVAITGESAIQRFQESEQILRTLSDRYTLKREQVVETLAKWQSDRRQLERQIDDLKMQVAKGGSGNEEIVDCGNVKVMLKRVSDVSGGALRQLADEMMDRIKGGVVLLGSDLGESAQLIVKVKAEGLHAGQLVREMAQIVGGKGGGRPDMAMAGGKDVSKLDDALKMGLARVEQELQS